jgi:hypothetical protein
LIDISNTKICKCYLIAGFVPTVFTTKPEKVD